MEHSHKKSNVLTPEEEARLQDQELAKLKVANKEASLLRDLSLTELVACLFEIER